MKIRLFLVALFLLFFINRISATDYYVNAATGSNTTGDGSLVTPWKTITYALSKISGTGHNLHVDAGTYDTSLGEVFPIYMKNGVSLTGAGIDLSIVDGTGSAKSVFYCIGIVDATTKFSGFTVTGGGGSEGGGFNITAGSVLQITNNKITHNISISGSGIYVLNSSPKILNNSFIFNDNTSIYISNSSPVVKGNTVMNNLDNSIYITGSGSAPSIINNIIANNTANGIYCTSSCIPSIINNTISDNSNNGIYISEVSPDSIYNNIISFNSGYGVYESSATSDPLKVSYNLFYLNSTGCYYNEGSTVYLSVSSLNTEVEECKNNIEGDPLFVDKANYDFHELSYSQAIDAGDPLSPYNNEPESNGDRINIGAYGNTTEAVIYAEVPVWGTDLFVNAVTGSNTTGDGSAGNPWKTITYALSRLSGTGLTIHVAAGNYNPVLGEAFPIYLKNGISLSGAGIDISIIDAVQTNSVIKCISIFDSSTKVEGFTIKGGYLTYPANPAGTGIFIASGSSVRIVNNKITDNEIVHHPWNPNQNGVGIYIENSSPVILNNIITNNTGDFTEGTGIFVYNASPLIEGNMISANPAWTGAYDTGSELGICGSLSSPLVINNTISDGDEHGLRCSESAKPRIKKNSILDNSRNGIEISSSNPKILNNTISGNLGHGIYISTISMDSVFNNIISFNSNYGICESGTSSDPEKVWYNLFYANSSGLYKDEGSTDYYTAGSLNSGVAECKNNLDGDPLFVDKTLDNYHLLTGSPAIDAGDPNSPLDPDGSRSDIGAFHYLMPPPAAPVANAPLFTGQTDLIMNWNTTSTAEGYFIDLATDSSFTNYVSGFNNRDILNRDSYSVIGLTASTTYYYRIRAYNVGGTGPNSNVITISTLTDPPAAPESPVSNSASDINQTTITANWSSVATATSYKLDVSTNNSFSSFVAGFNSFEILNVISYQVTGLAANTEYFYRLRASNSGGQSASSNIISATTLPTPPSAPDGVSYNGLSQTSFNATWNISATAIGYYLDVATDNTFTSFVSGYNNQNTGNVTTTSVTGLSANTTYYFRVRAYNTGGTSSNSTIVQLTTLPDPPSPPTATPATDILQTSFNANWNASTNATGYYLDVSDDNTFASFISGYNSKDVSNVITLLVNGLSANTNYYYRVRAYNTGGASSSSNTITLTTLLNPPDPPSAPEAITATKISKTSFTANWNSVTGATGYRLDVSTDNSFTGFVTGYNNKEITNSESDSVGGLTLSTNYFYRVRATNSGGESASSNTIAVTTLSNPPASPVCTSASSVTQFTFTANWNPASTASGYRIDVSTEITFATFVSGYNDLDVGNVTNSLISGLSLNTTYYYRVRAYNDGGTGDNSNTISITTLLNAPTLPSAPTALSATGITQTGFTARWNTSSTSTGYYIDVSGSSSFTTFLTGYSNKYVGNVTSTTVTGLTQKSSYYYRVRASNSYGSSGNSNSITVATLPDPPAAPAGLTVSSCNDNVTLTWTANTESDFLRYRIYAGMTANPITILDSTATGAISATSITLSGLTHGRTYYFRLTAVVSPNVASTYSSSVSVIVKKGVIPKIKGKFNKVLICYNLGDSISAWQWHNGTTAISGAIKQYYVINESSGSYSVVSTDKNGCKNSSNIISITGTKSISVYPNPAKNRFELNYSSEVFGRALITLYNSSGKKVLEYQREKPDEVLKCEIPVDNLLDGIYTLEVLMNEGELSFTRVVVIN